MSIGTDLPFGIAGAGVQVGGREGRQHAPPKSQMPAAMALSTEAENLQLLRKRRDLNPGLLISCQVLSKGCVERMIAPRAPLILQGDPGACEPFPKSSFQVTLSKKPSWSRACSGCWRCGAGIRDPAPPPTGLQGSVPSSHLQPLGLAPGQALCPCSCLVWSPQD